MAPFKIMAGLTAVAVLAGCANCGDQPGWGLHATAGQGFRPLEPIVGSNFSANAGSSRFFNEPGTPEYFRLLSERPDGPLSIAFPRVLLNTQWIDLPEVRADPILRRRCARGV